MQLHSCSGDLVKYVMGTAMELKDPKIFTKRALCTCTYGKRYFLHFFSPTAPTPIPKPDFWGYVVWLQSNMAGSYSTCVNILCLVMFLMFYGVSQTPYLVPDVLHHNGSDQSVTEIRH